MALGKILSFDSMNINMRYLAKNMQLVRTMPIHSTISDHQGNNKAFCSGEDQYKHTTEDD